jgi:hypothetical protein
VAERLAVERLTEGLSFPPSFEASIDFALRGVSERVRVIASARWNVYRSKIDAFLVRGSYSFSTNEFKGQFSTPSIDMWSSHPGDGWTLLTEVPSQFKNRVVFVRHGGKLDAAIRGELWDTAVATDAGRLPGPEEVSHKP